MPTYRSSEVVAFGAGTHLGVPATAGVEPQVSLAWLVSKRLLDLLGSLLLLTLLALPLLVIAALIAMHGGPVLFRQPRIGRDGRAFGCLKFRTMVPDAERRLAELLERRPELRAEWDRDRKLRDDPRVTPVGRWLRKTSLDELPQLINVLKGDMSMIGPRPVVGDELARYGKAARWYLAVRPGISGLWQVSGRNDVNYRRRVALDSYYVRNQGLWLDVQIALKTVRVVLLRNGAY